MEQEDFVWIVRIGYSNGSSLILGVFADPDDANLLATEQEKHIGSSGCAWVKVSRHNIM